MAADVAVYRFAVSLRREHAALSLQTGLGVLGATGTVGRAGLEAAAALGIKPVMLAARSDAAGMLGLIAEHKPARVVMADPDAAQLVRNGLPRSCRCEVAAGDGELAAAAADCETVLAAISGVAGLPPTLRALRAGVRVLLANKEALILAGSHLLNAACSEEAIIPIDSEHNALAELLLLARRRRHRIARVWLTASGGPFYDTADTLAEVTPDQAVRHPVWNMGAKISVDSATLMNKGLEVIEACLLFSLKPADVEVVVHPQSVMHALVEFSDGGCLAQCGPADMRATIARALCWPDIPQTSFGRINWSTLGRLDFLPPDNVRFPCLRLAYEALDAGGSAPAVLNAANEIAVESFLSERLGFAEIPDVVARTMQRESGAADTLDELIAADARAREVAKAIAGERV